MAQRKEKLSDEQLQKINDLQNKISEVVLNVGEGHLRIRDLKNEIERLEGLVKDYEKSFDSYNDSYNKLITELEKQYPNAEIDLAEGTVTIEE